MMALYRMEPPSEKQKEFFLAREKYVAYGGARGGGKSWAVRKKAVLMALHYPGIRILILRRTFPELRENHVLPLMRELKPLAKAGACRYRQSDNAIAFKNGSRVKFGYCQNDEDALQYQGQEYDVIFMDEATHFSYEQFDLIQASLRGANDFPKRFYLTCNPGGVGHGWVKRLFIDRSFTGKERPEEYRFIQARVYDNKYLLEKDPEYLHNLERLSPEKRAAWLEGRWDVFEGQYFPEFGEGHVCEPFEIPKHWRRYFAMDYGLDMFAGYWAAADEKGELWIYREAYQSDLIASDAAKMVKRMTGEERLEGDFAPPDMWNRKSDTGATTADAFAGEGIYLTRVSNDRVNGWLEMKEWTKVRENGKARLHVFSCCRNLIGSFPNLLHSQKNPIDVDTEPHKYTHGPDAIRYLLAGRPAPAEKAGAARTQAGAGWYEEQMTSFLRFGR